jgi:hypothetical protein
MRFSLQVRFNTNTKIRKIQLIKFKFTIISNDKEFNKNNLEMYC